ncbi:MAG: FAD-dependent oxidoreductase [Acetobacterales bacterium]
MADTHVIVGAGQAGNAAAFAMRQSRFAGRIILVGAEPYRPYERPPLSKTVITGETMPDPAYFCDAPLYEKNGIELLTDRRACAIDCASQHVRLDDGSDLPFDRLLLATGGRARGIPVEGGEHIHYLRSFDDARATRSGIATATRVLCIGAGVIGLELAASARSLGRSVTVLEGGATAMGRCLSPEGSDFVERLHRGAGTEILYGVTAVAIEEADGTLRVACSDGVVREADVVLAGVGMVRNVELAEAAALEIDDGIVADAFGTTSADNIYAAGDVAACRLPGRHRLVRYESWQHAQDHGAHVGRSMAGERAPYRPIARFWTDQYDVTIQVIGETGSAERTIVRESADDRSFLALHVGAGGLLVGVTAANRPRDGAVARRLIQAGVPLDMDALADPAVPLDGLLKAMKASRPQAHSA